MWKTLFNRSVTEARFVVKNAAEANGLLYFVQKQTPFLMKLNPRTFFCFQEVDSTSNSPCSVKLSFRRNLEDVTIDFTNMSPEEVEKAVIKQLHYACNAEGQSVMNAYKKLHEVKAGKEVNQGIMGRLVENMITNDDEAKEMFKTLDEVYNAPTPVSIDSCFESFNPEDLNIPLDIVEASKTVKYLDDAC